MEKENLTLLIMAAGMGSRFGGLKQIEPFGPNDEFLIDYSIYDAMQAGFTKVVFIIKEENYKDFKDTVGKRVESHIPVQYVFQKLEIIPDGFQVPENRVKPWGTAHAIYCAKDVIHEKFAIINADDFYGRDAFMKIGQFLRESKKTDGKDSYGLVGYFVRNTLTENGSVKRGICKLKGEYLETIVESNVIREKDKIIASPLDGRDSFEVTDSVSVSMNMFGFDPSLFSYIEEKMTSFFEANRDSLETCEFLISDVLTDLIREGRITLKVLGTDAKWMGVTYKEDKPSVVSRLNHLIEERVYKEDLWEN